MPTHTLPAVLVDADTVFLNATQVRSRYGGVSDMALWRWLRDEDLGFPKPIRIKGRRFWLVSSLVAWERTLCSNAVSARRGATPVRLRERRDVKRLNSRRVKIHRAYTVEEVAKLLQVHKNTVRGWLWTDLQAIDDRRPTLILGRQLAAFLHARRDQSRRRCRPDEFYCCPVSDAQGLG